MGKIKFKAPVCLRWREDTPLVAEADPFLWRNKPGALRPITELSTSYLVNIVKMIWNNSVDEHFRIAPIHIYQFPPCYTTQYMRAAVVAILKELKTREIPQPQLEQLQSIAVNLLPAFDNLISYGE